MRLLLALIVSAAFVAQPQAQIAFAGLGDGQHSAVQIGLDSVVSDQTPGSTFKVRLTFDVADGVHIGAAGPPEAEWYRTEFRVADANNALQDVSALWPKPHSYTQAGITVPVHEGSFAVDVLLRVKDDAALGPISGTITADFQACTATECGLPEQRELQFQLNVVAGPPRDITDPQTTGGLFDWDQLKGLGVAALQAFIGGILLNLWPCILPMIPLKISALRNMAGGRFQLFMHMLLMGIGMVAVWAAIGILIATLGSVSSTGFLFQSPLFTIGVGIFIGVMGLGMFELYIINPPAFLTSFSVSNGTLRSAFLFGVMSAVMATPCTGPFMGTAAAWAVQQQNALLTLVVFSSIGAGLAAPYFLLVLFPGLTQKLPKSGDWSTLLKQGAGGFTIAAACWYTLTGLLQIPLFAPFIGTLVPFWVALVVLVATCGWIIVRTWRLTKSYARRLIVTAIFAGIAGLGIWGTVSLAIIEHELKVHKEIWQTYSADRLTEMTAEGRIVLVECTSPTCLNCKALELTVLHASEIRTLLKDKKVIAMVADVSTSEGEAYLKSLGATSVPLIAVYGPAVNGKPFTAQAYTVATLKDFIRQAAGE